LERSNLVTLAVRSEAVKAGRLVDSQERRPEIDRHVQYGIDAADGRQSQAAAIRRIVSHRMPLERAQEALELAQTDSAMKVAMAPNGEAT